MLETSWSPPTIARASCSGTEQRFSASVRDQIANYRGYVYWFAWSRSAKITAMSFLQAASACSSNACTKFVCRRVGRRYISLIDCSYADCLSFAHVLSSVLVLEMSLRYCLCGIWREKPLIYTHEARRVAKRLPIWWDGISAIACTSSGYFQAVRGSTEPKKFDFRLKEIAFHWRTPILWQQVRK